MAKLDGVFNSEDFDDFGNFTLLPPGQYDAMIVNSDIEATKKGGKMIVLEIAVQGGEHDGETIKERLNIENESDKTVSIAYKKLATIVRSVFGTDKSIKNTEELHNKRFSMLVGQKPGEKYTDKVTGEEKDGYAQNEIKKFLPYGGQAPATATKQSVAETAPKTVEQSPQSAATPPWKRKSV